MHYLVRLKEKWDSNDDLDNITTFSVALTLSFHPQEAKYAGAAR